MIRVPFTTILTVAILFTIRYFFGVQTAMIVSGLTLAFCFGTLFGAWVSDKANEAAP